MTSGLKRTLRLVPGILLIGLQSAVAKPLTTQECTRLVDEHTILAKKDVETLMDRDPSEAKDLLKPEQLADIERYLYLEGEIRFRCPEVKLAIPEQPAPEPEKAAAKAATKETAAPAGPSVPMPDRNPKRL